MALRPGKVKKEALVATEPNSTSVPDTKAPTAAEAEPTAAGHRRVVSSPPQRQDNSNRRIGDSVSSAVAWLSLIAIFVAFLGVFMSLSRDISAEEYHFHHHGVYMDFNESGVDVKIFLRTFGNRKEAKFHVLLLPDVFSTAFSFYHTALGLAAFGAHVIMFDFPGQGFSTPPDPPAFNSLSLVKQHALWIENVREALEIDDGFHIIAQGTALNAACSFERAHSKHVRSLTSFGTNMFPRRANVAKATDAGMFRKFDNLLHPLAHYCECGCSEDPSLHATDKEYLHNMRKTLLDLEARCNPRNISLPMLWIAEGEKGPSLRHATHPIKSSSVCLHIERVNDFLLSVLGFYGVGQTTSTAGQQ